MINAAITFFITAAVVYFLVVLPSKALIELLSLGKEERPVAVPEDVVLLREIRDALRERAADADDLTLPRR